MQLDHLSILPVSVACVVGGGLCQGLFWLYLDKLMVFLRFLFDNITLESFLLALGS